METYVQRDVRQLTEIRDLSVFTRFLRLCAGRVGQIVNLSRLGDDLGVSHPTIRHWLTILEASFIVFLLPSWHTKISKRQIKRPKLYFYDVGLAAYLLSIEQPSHVSTHPLRGNLFENMVVIEALKHRYHRAKRENLSFWRDAKGNEVDLIIEHGASVTPLEIKVSQTVRSDDFKGLQIFANRLKAHQLRKPALVYGGHERQQRSFVEALGYADISRFLIELI